MILDLLYGRRRSVSQSTFEVRGGLDKALSTAMGLIGESG